jgi:cell fate regulator YaaT (PSP1 superfamily)
VQLAGQTWWYYAFSEDILTGYRTIRPRFLIAFGIAELMDAPAAELSYVVRYGGTRILGEFSARGMQPLVRNASVIVRSDRGHEWGTVLCTATDQTRSYLGDSSSHGRIVRTPTPDDERQWDRVRQMERGEYLSCRDLIAERKLQMQLVDVEHLFGGERAVFYYVAEQRVDFRDLVKALAGRHKIRIEMRQIGVRDEAKLLADYGDCGQPVCPSCSPTTGTAANPSAATPFCARCRRSR